MSITGKVLSVLVILVALVWVALTSAVAQLNRNGAEAVEKLQAQVLKLEAEVAAAERSLVTARAEWTQDQVETNNALAVLQIRQSDVEKAHTVLQEIQTRVALQVAEAEAIAKGAAEDRDRNVADKKSETDDLAKARADVEQLKTKRTEMVGRLNALRAKFKSTLDENRSLVERLQKKGGVPASRPSTPTARPASFSR